MKKIISLILTIVMLLSAVITVNASSFKDVKSSDWYYSSVNYVADKGIMNGTSNTKFSPKASLTRAMGVTLLYRVAGSPSVAGVTLPFNDVKGGQWYTDTVKWAYSKGIVTGKSNTFFHTNGNITRAEFATILFRYSDLMKYSLPSNRADFVTDVGKIPSWAFAAVTVMYKAEIINGRDGGYFDPNAKITRAEAAAMIERFMKVPKDGSSNNTNTETQPPVQNDPVPTTGKLVIKEKKYDYNGANVMILNVENQTSKHLNVTISAKYLDASGKTLYAENRMIEGFPANYQNYVVLQPGIKFDKFTYEVKTSAYNGETYAQYFSIAPNPFKVYAAGNTEDMFNQRDNIRACVFTEFVLYFNGSARTGITSDIVLFDTSGNIYLIYEYNGSFDPSEKVNELRRSKTFDDKLIQNFSLPNNVNTNSQIILAVKTAVQK